MSTELGLNLLFIFVCIMTLIFSFALDWMWNKIKYFADETIILQKTINLLLSRIYALEHHLGYEATTQQQAPTNKKQH